MKTFKPYILVLVVSIVASLGLMSCLKGGTISSIEVTPANANMASGEMQQFIATAKFSDGTSLNWTSAVNWNSSNTEVAIVSNVTGSNGIVTAVALSTATTIITATDLTNNLSGNATLTVNNPVTIAVTPVNALISMGTTTKFTAKAIFTQGTEIDLTSVVFWSSSNTAVAIVSNVTGSNGIASAVGVGTTSITATDLITNITGTATLTVQ